MKNAIFAAALLLAACGKVSAPLPPIIRVPLKIDNLSAAQAGYTVALTWTNPSTYVDGNPATDTGVVHVFRDDVEIGTVAAAAAGQPQSFPIDVRKSVGSPLTFAIQLVVPKAGKPSPVSNEARIQPVDVPGSPRNLVPTVDLGKIVLVWDAPELNPDLVDSYVVQRSDKPAALTVPAPRFEDTEYEPGKTYKYTITAVRGTSPQIPGEGKLEGDVVAIDKNPPAIPIGLEVERLTEGVVLVRWEQNTEKDLRGYKLYRSDRPEQPIRASVENVYTDRDHVSGRGISYQVLAEDISGNESPKSAPRSGP